MRPISPLGLAGLLLAAGAGLAVLLAFYTRKGAYGSDWQTFFAAAERLRDGRRVYTVADGFFNPPPVLLLMRLFLPLGYLPSRVLWGLLSTAMLLASAGLSADACGWRPSIRERLIGAWLILFAVPTVLLAPLTGNFSAVVLFGFALALRLFYRGRDGWAGAALACTLVKPQLALLPLPLLLYKRRWRAAAGYLAATALSELISLPLVGLQTYRDYLGVQRAVADWTRTNDAMQLDVPGIHGMLLQHWPQSVAADRAGNLIAVLLVLALAWSWRGPWRPGTIGFAAHWSMLLLTTLLIASFAHSYDLVLLITPAVSLYVLRGRATVRWPYGAVLVALYATPALVLLLRQHFVVPAMLAALALLWRPAWTGQQAAPQEPPPPAPRG